MNYEFRTIEKKWQQFWSENQTFRAENQSEKPNYYVLDMFPYPSGAGLHVGHPLGYIASDIYARYKRHKGFNVLHPMGYDSFGLPAEQYAIQTGQHPAITTKENIARYREQLDRIGFSFDWSREVRTSSPEYYKWTQWIFIQLFNSYYNNDENKAKSIDDLISVFKKNGNQTINAKCDDDTPSFSSEDWNSYSEEEQEKLLLKYRLTYLAEAEVNWCPGLGTVLANDEVVNGVSERGGFPVIRKKMTQWMMRITAYAERLLNGIEYNQKDLDISEALRESQKNWIGKSNGASVFFRIEGHQGLIEVFTTRPDTIFGVSFMVLAPEHSLVAQITTDEQKTEVEEYIQQTAKRSERERMADVKTISGAFTGAYAIHPFTGKQIPIWIGDYVLASYGTGAVMSVPCGDERDYAFANHFKIEIPNIFKGIDISEEAFTDKTSNVTLTNSDFLDGLNVKEATKKIIAELEAKKIGKGKINYRLRDAVFSRQRYWGEPVPIYFENGIPKPIPTECLPLELPEIDEYLPTETGEPPLGRAKAWVWDAEKKCVTSPPSEGTEGRFFPLELNTMPGWAGSSWYMFRYMDANNPNEFASKEALNYWQQVDLYLGGSEHATGHLLYVRFWTKFLKDVGLINVEEPFKKLINQGMILGNSAFVHRMDGTNQLISAKSIDEKETTKIHSLLDFVDESNDTLDIEKFKNWREDFKDAEFITEEDGKFYVSREVEKMSKSKFNVLNPDDICDEYGADTLRMYEMFLGPIEQAKPWNTQGLSGVYGFLKKFWRLFHAPSNFPEGEETFNISDQEPTKAELKVLHQTIKKVTEDIENFSFNTSISTFMIATNELQKLKCNKKAILEPLVVLIAPFAPHIAEELWEKLGNTTSVSTAEYPIYQEKFLVEDSKEYPISFNGKMKFTMEMPLSLSKEEIEKTVLEDERTQKQLAGRTPKKVIVVPGKIVNLVG